MMELPFRYILTVSELTQEIKNILDLKFSDIWIEGEISNLRIPPSGHIYFTLKDDFSQIRAVLFKMQARTLRFVLEDGLHVVCRGRVSVYERRGEYQLILEEVEPKGIGAFQLAFLQLKDRLEKEGLFAPAHKKPIPMVPQTIGIVTSPTGAVIRDMLHIIHRRFENVHILLHPVRVQGEGAPLEIAKAIEDFNKRMNVDVIIVGRGGGSLEDLWSFNEEIVARAIYHSKIPIVSAVGHETDYTISDFVADFRAPTPSAAAELVVRDKREIKNTLHYLEERLENQILQTLQENRTNLSHLKKMLTDPRKMIEEYFLRVDDLVNRFRILTSWTLKRKRERSLHLSERLYLQNPIQRVKNLRLAISEIGKRLGQTMRYSVEIQRQKVEGIFGKLGSLSPLSILQRGYSITRKFPSLQILRDAVHVREGDKVEVRLHKGTLLCGVEKVHDL
ncbi:MAG: exodeoxyribonuclease VII large subunit [Desulfobacterales bacterium]|nr:exodeoxyribonuclease VII large subunit [Desulfobacterales bacterium]